MRSLLGLDPAAAPLLSGMSVGELTKLVYRDHIPMKHASRKRLASEIQMLESNVQPQQRQRRALEAGNAGKDLLSQLLVQYLMQASQLILSGYNDK